MSRVPEIVNLFTAPAARGPGEHLETLLERPGLRLERIVSFGHATPEGDWFDQPDDEWVMLASGRARLFIEGEERERILVAGDCLFLPAHCRHRVTWTDEKAPAIWLALHIAP